MLKAEEYLAVKGQKGRMKRGEDRVVFPRKEGHWKMECTN